MQFLGAPEVENLLQLFRSLKNRTLPYGLISGLAAETSGQISDFDTFVEVVQEQ